MKRFAIEINGRYCYDYQTKGRAFGKALQVLRPGRVVTVWDLLTGDFYDAENIVKK